MKISRYDYDDGQYYLVCCIKIFGFKIMIWRILKKTLNEQTH